MALQPTRWTCHWRWTSSCRVRPSATAPHTGAICALAGRAAAGRKPGCDASPMRSRGRPLRRRARPGTLCSMSPAYEFACDGGRSGIAHQSIAATAVSICLLIIIYLGSLARVLRLHWLPEASIATVVVRSTRCRARDSPRAERTGGAALTAPNVRRALRARWTVGVDCWCHHLLRATCKKCLHADVC